MALTAQQLADVRRYAGYPLLADSVVDDSRDFAYGWVSPGVWQTLSHRLTNLRPEEESILINSYLTKLATLETAITDAGANLDTEQAAVWKRNANEVRDRASLFDQWRRRMCDFIGIAPGPSLGRGGISIGRA
ncbi:putative phage protein [Cupriavidus necator]|uniref:Putative phage protein n=1 Tax=Cupriavidus necator TaxID=106590 RepID=A0A1K0JC55_CUPNE|nr:putative phage protein [Cupriavidus necator]